MMTRRIAAGAVLAALMIISLCSCHVHVTAHASPGFVPRDTGVPAVISHGRVIAGTGTADMIAAAAARETATR